MEQIDKKYKEEIEIPIYDDEDFYASSECHFKTKPKTFKFEEILAIVTKNSTIEMKYHYSRGGALIFVRNRENPYLTEDHWGVKEIYQKLNENPFACLSGLNAIGSSRIYAKEGILKGNEYILPNGVHLYLTADAIRKLKFINYIMTRGTKRTCFFETKRMNRKKFLKK